MVKIKGQEVTAQANPHTVVAIKPCHVGALFGHISNGGGTIALDDNYGLHFVRDGSDFVKLELIRYGVQALPTNQTWTKSKKVKAKPKVVKKEKVKIADKPIEEVSLFE